MKTCCSFEEVKGVLDLVLSIAVVIILIFILNLPTITALRAEVGKVIISLAINFLGNWTSRGLTSLAGSIEETRDANGTTCRIRR